MTTGILQNKKGLITGIANEKSIASAIAKYAYEQGAEIAISYQNNRLQSRAQSIAEKINCDQLYECDLAKEEEVKNMAKKIEHKWGEIDFILHGAAYADAITLKGKYVDISLQHFIESMTISCYSLNMLTKYFMPMLKKASKSSIVTLSYYGAEKVMPSYNLMGVAKAALEASVKYLANDLGEDNIRVNAVSAGPIRTLAASAISGFAELLNFYSSSAPLKRNVTTHDVAKSCVYLFSDLSSAVTGEVHFVDCGYNIMGACVKRN